jgi:DNA polymerase-1
MDLVFDIETDDVQATKVWCIVAQDTGSSEIYKFAPHQLESGLELLQSAETLIGHNIIGFDIPVIHKLLGVDLSDKKLIDTLVLSRLFNPVREGGHSLEMWGYRLKYSKQDFNDYTNYSKEMMNYCVRDVQLNTLVFEKLKEESKGFSSESIYIEQEVSKILKKQEEDGFLFDRYNAEILLAKLREKMRDAEDQVHKVFKPKLVDVKEVTPYIKKDGSLSKRGLTDEEYDKVFSDILLQQKEIDDKGEVIIPKPKPFMRRKLQDFNLGSRKQIGEYLQDFGWKPQKFTATGRPIVDEKTLSNIENIPEVKMIADYLLLQKRIAQIDSWIEAVEDDDRVHGFVIPNGTITGRMSHRSPNMAQVPSIKSPFGVDCRSCWIVSKGHKLVGIDASSLELRMLAHYMQDKEFTREIIHGDVHKRNQETAGLQSRDQAKTFIYALLYGAGDAKIGQVVGGSKKDGARLKQRFFANQPSFKRLRERVSKASAKGYLKGLDGRKIHIRHIHASLNSLLQGAGAIVMKKALIMLNEKATERSLDFKFVANIHDEWQVEVINKDVEEFGSLAVEAIKEAGEHFNLGCPLDAEYKTGENWSETH